MNIVDKVRNEYKKSKSYGVRFSIEPSAYEYTGKRHVEFGKNFTCRQLGTLLNFQDIIIDGKKFGYLEETERSGLFSPILTSFSYPIADCQDKDYDEVFEANKNNPHFYDNGESLELRFATLEQFMEFYEQVNNTQK